MEHNWLGLAVEVASLDGWAARLLRAAGCRFLLLPRVG